MFLHHNWLVFCVMPGLTGHLDPRSESGMTMEFGDGSPIGVGDDECIWLGMTSSLGWG